MRKSLISLSTIDRLISSARSRAKEEARINLIKTQSTNMKELPLTYSLIQVDFSMETRVAKLVFQQSQQYRTIVRYVTQNYVRYPVYSEWKTKTKIIKKSIRLTNQTLETLNLNEDPLVRKFSKDIVTALNANELMPSWFIKEFLDDEFAAKNKELDKQLNDYFREKDNEIDYCKRKITNNDNLIKRIEPLLNEQTAKSLILTQKIDKARIAKRSIFLYIITLGFYKYYCSMQRRSNLERRLLKIKESIFDLEQRIKWFEDNNDKYNNAINEYNENKLQKEYEIKELKAKEQIKYNEKLNAIRPLDCHIRADKSFKPLKDIIGYEYQKIIGCYIIHNKENDKYYVGQSKDIMKRIKQHFKGTVPNNIIFAEDYYSSALSDKSELFEIKIIPCKTKDELDSTEKNLISLYDSWNTGYNGTSGNL